MTFHEKVVLIAQRRANKITNKDIKKTIDQLAVTIKANYIKLAIGSFICGGIFGYFLKWTF